MKTTFTDSKGNKIQISSVFRGDKLAPWSNRYGNRNHHRVTVKTEYGRTSFDFWCSAMCPEMKTESDLLNAFERFIGDAIIGDGDFSDFSSEFGYDERPPAEKAYRACQSANKKLTRIYRDDIWELFNEIIDSQNT